MRTLAGFAFTIAALLVIGWFVFEFPSMAPRDLSAGHIAILFVGAIAALAVFLFITKTSRRAEK